MVERKRMGRFGTYFSNMQLLDGHLPNVQTLTKDDSFIHRKWFLEGYITFSKFTPVMCILYSIF